ncbi:MAG: type II toxin-antitoxin system VapC family toxin [Actinomycetia bacterium]|nr:type II toxin-antitoxin system VapC family toxin [Actinomycetes bacterium]
MIVDASAVIAILEREPEASELIEILLEEPSVMSASGYLECGVVWDRRNPRGREALDALLAETETSLIPFTPDHAAAARAAYRRYGRGSGHPARLNLGDCMSYAVAALDDEPLLFTGRDFSHTDVRDARG